MPALTAGQLIGRVQVVVVVVRQGVADLRLGHVSVVVQVRSPNEKRHRPTARLWRFENDVCLNYVRGDRFFSGAGIVKRSCPNLEICSASGVLVVTFAALAAASTRKELVSNYPNRPKRVLGIFLTKTYVLKTPSSKSPLFLPTCHIEVVI